MDNGGGGRSDVSINGRSINRSDLVGMQLGCRARVVVCSQGHNQLLHGGPVCVDHDIIADVWLVVYEIQGHSGQDRHT